ncbi:unnamed protein product, partial [Symbiodinium necroappetens]
MRRRSTTSPSEAPRASSSTTTSRWCWTSGTSLKSAERRRIPIWVSSLGHTPG